MKDLNGFINYLKAQVTKNELSLDAYTKVARDFIEFMGNKQPTQDAINEFLVQQRQKYIKNNSMINKCGGLRHFLRYNGYDLRRRNEGEHRGFLVQIPRAEQTKTTPDDFLTEPEIQAMYNTAKRDAFEDALVRVFYYAMQRISSVISLDVEDVNFTDKTITFRKMKKTNKPHVETPDDATLQAIRTYIGDRTTGALFLNRTISTRINDDQLRKQLKIIAIDSGIKKNVTPHMFRRSNITHKKLHGVQDSDIMKISGHKDVNSLKHYDCTDLTYVRKITEKFTPKFDNATPTPKAEPVDKEKEEMKKTIKELSEKLEEAKKHNDNRMYG
jgi:integrase/recombinase XerD